MAQLWCPRIDPYLQLNGKHEASNRFKSSIMVMVYLPDPIAPACAAPATVNKRPAASKENGDFIKVKGATLFQR